VRNVTEICMNPKRARQLAVIAAMALALSACATTMGTGEGVLRGSAGQERIALAWKTTNGINGAMTATLPGSTRYVGPFFQITSQTRRDDVALLWYGWGGRYDWDNWSYGTMPDFITYYSGKVLANLRDGSGAYMRCRFHLAMPSVGIIAGGAGECETTGGQTYDARFPGR
jgi:predicted small secreted protein